MDSAHPCVACYRVGAHTVDCPTLPGNDPCVACSSAPSAPHRAGCPMSTAPVVLAVTPPGATEPTLRTIASAPADLAEPKRVMRLRCPRETAATEARHVAMDVRLPLDINTLATFVKGLKCPCGADFVLVQKGGA